MTCYSVQQIKFECFAYIKEHGARFTDWVVGSSADPKAALFDSSGGGNSLDAEQDLWLWKPALTAAAARSVVTLLTARYGVVPAASGNDPAGTCIFLYRKPA